MEVKMNKKVILGIGIIIVAIIFIAIKFQDDNSNISHPDKFEEYNTFSPKYVYYGRNASSSNSTNYWRILNQNMESIQVLTFGPLVTSVAAIGFTNLKYIYCMMEEPAGVDESFSFGGSTYANTTLYVPIGTKEKYANANGWKKFFNIQEMDVAYMWNGNGEPNFDESLTNKCDKPTISYKNGRIIFACATEDAIFHSTITDTDVKSYNEKEIQLGVTYNINVYASKTGYKDSEKVTATLCWLDVEPKTEGIENDIAQVSANAVLIQSHNGQITITGAKNGTNIFVFSASGQMVANRIANGNESILYTNLRQGEVAIIKIGEKSVKVVMQ